MTDREHFGRRLKAAMTLRDLSVAELAERVPPQFRMSTRTLDRIAQGKRPPNDWEVPLLAELLNVPEWFLVGGFSGANGDSSLDRDRADLEARRHEELLKRFDDQNEMLRELMMRLGDRERRA